MSPRKAQASRSCVDSTVSVGIVLLLKLGFLMPERQIDADSCRRRKIKARDGSVGVREFLLWKRELRLLFVRVKRGTWGALLP